MTTNIAQIKQETEKLTLEVQASLANVKKLAVQEAWKILQLTTAATIQIIEKLGTDLKSPDKKILAMSIISSFYDKVFLVVDVPFVPNFLEPVIHKYVKGFLMVLVSATIDALVTTFRQAGIFLSNKMIDNPYNPNVMSVSYIP